MQNLQNNGSQNEGLGNRCTPIPSMGDSREAASIRSSDCTPQQRLTTAFIEPNQSIESDRDPISKQSRPCDKLKSARRQKWTKEENILVWKCYLLSDPKKRGYRQRFHKIWLDNGGSNVTEQRICDQRSKIEKEGWLTKVEREMIQRSLDGTAETQLPTVVEVDRNEDEPERVIVYDQHETHADNHSNVPDNNESVVPDIEELEPLTEEEKSLLSRLNELMATENPPIFNLKKFNRYEVMSKTTMINKILKHLKPSTITETRNIMQAASSLVGELVGAKKVEAKPRKEPWWKRRIERDIESLRKDLSLIDRWFSGKWKNKTESKMNELDKKYHLKKLGFKTAIETIKQRILAKANKVKRYNKRCQQYQQNRLFQSDQKRFFQSLESNQVENIAPNPEDATKFWSNIWSNPVTHKESEWLGEIKKDLSNVEKQEGITITSFDLMKQLKRTASWKSPGPDGIHGFWYKNFPSLHKIICTQLNQCLSSNSIPEWMTIGRTVLLMKDPVKGNDVGNYRPIACLNIVWKILSGIFADKTYDHLEENELFPFEQKGCIKASRGTKDQLCIDKAILKNCKRRHTNMCMSWIDFKKAYDMVPHSWILETLRMFGVAENLINFIEASMPNWSTNLFCNNNLLGNVKIKRGIFQGDSFSPNE